MEHLYAKRSSGFSALHTILVAIVWHPVFTVSIACQLSFIGSFSYIYESLGFYHYYPDIRDIIRDGKTTLA
jgi:hypothetical protein